MSHNEVHPLGRVQAVHGAHARVAPSPRPLTCGRLMCVTLHCSAGGLLCGAERGKGSPEMQFVFFSFLALPKMLLLLPELPTDREVGGNNGAGGRGQAHAGGQTPQVFIRREYLNDDRLPGRDLQGGCQPREAGPGIAAPGVHAEAPCEDVSKNEGPRQSRAKRGKKKETIKVRGEEEERGGEERRSFSVSPVLSLTWGARVLFPEI